MTDVQAEAGPSSSSAPKPSTIPIRLTSRSERYAIPESKYMVPSDWRRFQLSELINKVLETTQAVPFDFIIDDQLLRTSLAAYTESKGLTEVSGKESPSPWLVGGCAMLAGLFVVAQYCCCCRVPRLRLFRAG